MFAGSDLHLLGFFPQNQWRRVPLALQPSARPRRIMEGQEDCVGLRGCHRKSNLIRLEQSVLRIARFSKFKIDVVLVRRLQLVMVDLHCHLAIKKRDCVVFHSSPHFRRVLLTLPHAGTPHVNRLKFTSSDEGLSRSQTGLWHSLTATAIDKLKQGRARRNL